MKLKIFTTLCLFAVASISQAANVSINDIFHLPGDSDMVEVPILISTASAETVTAMDISFSVGELADAVPIVSEDYNGSIWGAPNSSFFASSTAGTNHSVLSGVSRSAAPLEVDADGVVVTYTLDLSSVAPGDYELNANYLDGTNAFVLDGQNANPVDLVFSTGNLNVAVPEPSTVVMTALFAVMGLGVYFKRRRG